MPARYLDDPAKWPLLAAALRKAGEFGYDTETYNQPDKTSPQHRTKIHCWSVGILYGTPGPRGHRPADGVVLPRAALDCLALREVFSDGGVRKWAHNAPHDIHSTLNDGVAIIGCEDSLQYLRTAVPGMSGYGLKEAEQWALGLPPRPSFRDMTDYEVDVVSSRSHQEKSCVCGAKPCRYRQTSQWEGPDGVYRFHERVSQTITVPIHRAETRQYPVESFDPSHPRWAEWLEYSLADAVRGIMLVDWVRARKQRLIPWPWGERVTTTA